VNANDPPAASEPVPSRVAIDDVIRFGKAILAKTNLPLGVVQMHSRRAKHRLKLIFGEKPVLEALFGDPKVA
jgi:hypothetical protein